MTEMKKLGFGYMRLPLFDETDRLSCDMTTLCKMVDTFMARGFTYFDTAYVYHEMKSEEYLRESLVKRYPRSAFTIADKMPVFLLQNAEQLEVIFQEQLQRLGVDYIDYYLLHALSAGTMETCRNFKCFEFMSEKKAQGLMRHIGFSYHDEAEPLEQILIEHPEIDFIQLQINYLDWDSINIQSRRCLEVARKYHKPVVVMEPLKGGTLATLPHNAEELLKAHAPAASPASWALRFAASQPGVMTVLSGMSTYEQLDENTALMEHFTPINTAEREILAKAVTLIEQAVAIPCTACRYCVEGCPKQIAIPLYFSLYNTDKQSLNHLFSVQDNYFANYAQQFGKPSDCIECRQCETHCPQHLKIVDYLKLVAQRFEPQKP